MKRPDFFGEKGKKRHKICILAIQKNQTKDKKSQDAELVWAVLKEVKLLKNENH